MNSLQIDHGVLPMLSPTASTRFHKKTPKLAIYDLEYERTGPIFSVTGIRWKKKYIPSKDLSTDDKYRINVYLRLRVQPL